MNWYAIAASLMIANDGLGHLQAAIYGEARMVRFGELIPRFLRWVWWPVFRTERGYHLYYSAYWAVCLTLLIFSITNN